MDVDDHNGSQTGSDENNHFNPGANDWNNTLGEGHPIFSLSSSDLYQLTDHSLPADFYAVVQINHDVVDLEPVYMEANGTWYPTPISDYINLLPSKYATTSDVWAWFESRAFIPQAIFHFFHHDR